MFLELNSIIFHLKQEYVLKQQEKENNKINNNKTHFNEKTEEIYAIDKTEIDEENLTQGDVEGEEENNYDLSDSDVTIAQDLIKDMHNVFGKYKNRVMTAKISGNWGKATPEELDFLLKKIALDFNIKMEVNFLEF